MKKTLQILSVIFIFFTYYFAAKFYLIQNELNGFGFLICGVCFVVVFVKLKIYGD